MHICILRLRFYDRLHVHEMSCQFYNRSFTEHNTLMEEWLNLASCFNNRDFCFALMKPLILPTLSVHMAFASHISFLVYQLHPASVG